MLEQILQTGLAALQARAKARSHLPAGMPFPKLPPPPRPRASQDASSSTGPSGSGKAQRPLKLPEPMGPPPKKATVRDGSKRPPEPKVPPKKESVVGPPPKVSKSKQQAKSRPMPAKKLAVMAMLKTRSEWGRMRFRDRVDHQRKIKKQGAPCSTCTVRRKISTKAARAYIAAKAARAKRNVPVPKVGPSGLARHVLKREGLLKNPGERRESRVAKARREVEELDFAEPSEGGESLEPEGSEKGESEAPEVHEEVDETIEVEDEEGSCEEVVVREEPADSSQGAVEGPSSAKGASMGSFSIAGQTGVSPAVERNRRHRAAVAKGVPHAKAWKAEKARRRSAIHRKQGVQDRAKVHFKMTESWTKHFWGGGPEQPEDRQDSQREAEPDLPTVVIDKRGNEVAPASNKVYLRPLTRKEKTYYREEGPTELKPSVVPAVYAKKANRSEEARKEANRKRAARRKRLAGKGKWKSNVKKRQRSWQEEDDESDDPTWGKWQDPDRDPEDKGKDWWKDHPGGPGGGPAMAAVCSLGCFI